MRLGDLGPTSLPPRVSSCSLLSMKTNSSEPIEVPKILMPSGLQRTRTLRAKDVHLIPCLGKLAAERPGFA